MTNHKTEGYSAPKTLLISVLIILAGVAFTWVIFSTEPVAKREGATRKSPMLVETVQIEVGNHTPIIEAMGTVIPARKIQLKAKVSGQVISSSEQFVPGKTVKQDQQLLQLDPIDYQYQLQQSQSDLDQAQANLSLEMGEQMAALKDYQQLGRQVDSTQKSLILREPQLIRAKAQVAAAQASLDQVKLDLQRTQVTAPFDAYVQQTFAHLGTQVNTNDKLAELVGIDVYWIEATIPLDQLAWLEPISNDQGTPVWVQDQLAWSDQESRHGRLISIIGQVDDDTRMARVLIAVDDPIGYHDESLPKLTLGTFVKSRIAAKELTAVARIDRAYVRKNDTLWLMNDDQQLTIKSLNVIYRDEQYAYVQDSIKTGDQMIITDLSRVTEGAALRLNNDQTHER